MKSQWKTRAALNSTGGFTLLEMILVLFLLVGLLGIVVPRMSFGENVGSVGRKLIGTIRSLQGMAMLTQKTVRLYLDLDRGLYWPMVLDGNEEKVPVDAVWATPLRLPESIRFLDVATSQGRRESGRADFYLYPSGRIDTATIHVADASNNLLGIVIEPVTGTIKVSDERIEPPKAQAIPDRVRPLLQPVQTTGSTAFPIGKP
jgi:hypothetical protein